MLALCVRIVRGLISYASPQYGGFGAAQLGGLWPFKSKGT